MEEFILTLLTGLKPAKRMELDAVADGGYVIVYTEAERQACLNYLQSHHPNKLVVITYPPEMWAER